MRGSHVTTAVLVDAWGRPHQVRQTTIVGRLHDEDGLSILDATISRRHASLGLRDNGWLLTDFGSSNGTYVEGLRVTREVRVRDGDRLRFGNVKFFFLDGITAPPDVDTSMLGAFTVRARGTVAPPAPPNAIVIELREPTGGGGGVAVIDGTPVQLTLPQFELISLLCKRAQAGGSGFVNVPELASTLSLDSAAPNEDHVRQLVRRLRRLLAKAGIVGLIESSYGAGYRLALLRA